MEDEWDDAGSSTVVVEPVATGRIFGGRGRGFQASEDDRLPGGGRRNGENGFRGRRNDDGDSWGNKDDNGGGGFKRGGNRWGDNDGGGGYKGRGGGGRRNDGDEDGGGYKGRGGGRRNNEDDDGGFKKSGNNWGGGDDEDGGGGGGGFKGRGGRRNDGDEDGGFKPRGKRDDNEEGGEEKKKDIYIPPEPTNDENEMFGSNISSGINFDKYDSIQVKVSGEDIPKPIQAFQDANLRSLLLENIEKSHYSRPTPVQKHALPILMAGRDLMACAQTGSGKTAAFLVPIINKLMGEHAELVMDGSCVEPQAVIVSPTRELTKQIFEQARKFAHNSILKVYHVYGGTATFNEVKGLMNGCHILVATPGRLMSYVGSGRISFRSVRFAVLDEADRMLDMGFLEAMRTMLAHESMPGKEERQTLMFSATFPDNIQRLAGEFLNNYVFVAVGVVGGACSDVEQKIYNVGRFKKREKLLELLEEHGSEMTLVFVEQKRLADIIATFLSEKNYPTTSMHGDRLQREREIALSDFKNGKMNILVATNVAARGLDIKNVRHVINYDIPKEVEDYVHRIGRTGRVGNKGLASSFFDPDNDQNIASHLVTILEQAGQTVPDFLRGSGGYGDAGGSFGSGSFGGKDFRKLGNETYDSKPPEAAFEEEEW